MLAGALVDTVPHDVLSFPVVKYHQRPERVHAPYAFGELPRLLREIVSRFLLS
ncbi:MAG TPA: hypothetical protein VGV37_10145 [Aliidongia sp.]|uniref:hypothetical protein n=1 Tax=Aliidongia sp. TaxID=1914230 RepID=UPI002DDD6A02|nr:hypothetical protein [Aliidongia sp.]HEV2674891.1 hypothetical protein [Aliidongia sp.]